MSDFTHCEFGHLMVPRRAAMLGLDYLSHVHEDEALACCYFESMGWPRRDGLPA